MTTTQIQPKVPVTPDRVSDDLLRAAQAVLEKEGPGALTVRAIASRAGISTMAVYSRFGCKAKILEALYLRGFELLREELEKVPASPSSVQDITELAFRLPAVRSRQPGPLRIHVRAPAPRIRSRPSSRARKGCEPPSTSSSTGSSLSSTSRWVVSANRVLVSYLIWSAVHGELSLELTQSVRTPLAGWLINEPAVRREDLRTGGRNRPQRTRHSRSSPGDG